MFSESGGVTHLPPCGSTTSWDRVDIEIAQEGEQRRGGFEVQHQDRALQVVCTGVDKYVCVCPWHQLSHFLVHTENIWNLRHLCFYHWDGCSCLGPMRSLRNKGTFTVVTFQWLATQIPGKDHMTPLKTITSFRLLQLQQMFVDMAYLFFPPCLFGARLIPNGATLKRYILSTVVKPGVVQWTKKHCSLQCLI